MNAPRSRFQRLALAALIAFGCVVALTGASKKAKFVITFHLQGDVSDGSFVTPDPEFESIYFSKSPEITHNQMTAFRPFPGDDGYTNGAVFQLGAAGQQRMSVLKATSPGKLLRALVNGVPIDCLKIDSSGPNDSIVIWRGLTEEHFKLFERKLTRIE